MNELQKKEQERLQKLVADHAFTNTHADRDCVVCGKSKANHGEPAVEAVETAEKKSKWK